MAENKKQPKHSGFDAPAKGIVLSKNTIIKKNPDGTLSVKEPGKRKKR